MKNCVRRYMILLSVLAVLIVFVGPVSSHGAFYLDTTGADAVIRSTATSQMLYPNFLITTNKTYDQDVAFANGLIYGGTSNWTIASNAEIATFFGGQFYGDEALRGLYTDLSNSAYYPGSGGIYMWTSDTYSYDPATYQSAWMTHSTGYLISDYGSLRDGGPQRGAFIISESTQAPVPLPPSFLLLVPGLVGVAAVRRRIKK